MRNETLSTSLGREARWGCCIDTAWQDTCVSNQDSNHSRHQNRHTVPAAYANMQKFLALGLQPSNCYHVRSMKQGMLTIEHILYQWIRQNLLRYRPQRKIILQCEPGEHTENIWKMTKLTERPQQCGNIYVTTAFGQSRGGITIIVCSLVVSVLFNEILDDIKLAFLTSKKQS